MFRPVPTTNRRSGDRHRQRCAGAWVKRTRQLRNEHSPGWACSGSWKPRLGISVPVCQIFPSWLFPSLDVRRKKKRSPEATGRGRAVDTDRLTFCFLLLIGFDSLKKKRTLELPTHRPARCQRTWALQRVSNFCLAVIVRAAVQSKKQRTQRWDF